MWMGAARLRASKSGLRRRPAHVVVVHVTPARSSRLDCHEESCYNVCLPRRAHTDFSTDRVARPARARASYQLPRYARYLDTRQRLVATVVSGYHTSLGYCNARTTRHVVRHTAAVRSATLSQPRCNPCAAYVGSSCIGCPESTDSTARCQRCVRSGSYNAMRRWDTPSPSEKPRINPREREPESGA